MCVIFSNPFLGFSNEPFVAIWLIALAIYATPFHSNLRLKVGYRFFIVGIIALVLILGWPAFK